MRKLLSLIILLCLAACGDKTPQVASVMQKNDKYLSCTEIKLEINEADYYKKTAEKNEGFKAKFLLMPLGYVSTYVSASDALEAANSRIDYLQNISDILGCERKDRQMMTGPTGYTTPENNGYAPTGGYAPASAVPGNSYNTPAPYQPAPYQHVRIDENRYDQDRASGDYGQPM